MKRALLLAAAALCGSAQAAVIDFSEFGSGDVVTALVADGINVTVNSRAYRPGEDPYDRAMIFDSNSPSSNDPDLVGPFTDVRGGADLTPGNILIVSKDGDSSDPDDNNRGGWIEFVFDSAVTFESFVAFDMNDIGDLSLELFNGSTSLGTVTNAFAAPDNGFELVEFLASDVTRALFSFSDTGAIGNITFASNSVETPLPAAGVMFGAALMFGLTLRNCRTSQA